MRRDSVLTRSPPSRYPLLLLIPLRPAGLLTLLVMSAALFAALKAGLLGVPMMVILLSWFFKYSFAFLDRLSFGDSEAPVLSLEMIKRSMGEFRWLVPLLLVVTAFFASGVASYLLGAVAATLASVALLICLPAMLAIQGWSGRLVHSLNPSIWRIAMQSLGNDYRWAVGYTFAIAILCVVLPGMIHNLPQMLRIGLLLYAWLALIVVTGGALHAKREALAEKLPLVIRHLKAPSLEDIEREREQWLDSVYGSWRANALENAYRSVIERIEASTEPLQELRWLLNRLSAWQPPHFTNRVAGELISRLLREEREGEALRLVKDRRDIDPNFRLRQRQESLRLAQLAAQWGDQSTATALQQGYPD